MFVRVLQIFALKRTRERDFPFRSAAQRTNVALDCRTGTARAAFLADLAKNLNSHQLTVIIGSGEMKRVDLYIKVELELDEDEKPEKVASEICRQLEKLYLVRRAEVSNAVARD
jgi:predicted PhzF superfamily epimerase YddE/YHI9